MMPAALQIGLGGVDVEKPIVCSAAARVRWCRGDAKWPNIESGPAACLEPLVLGTKD